MNPMCRRARFHLWRCDNGVTFTARNTTSGDVEIVAEQSLSASGRLLGPASATSMAAWNIGSTTVTRCSTAPQAVVRELQELGRWGVIAMADAPQLFRINIEVGDLVVALADVLRNDVGDARARQAGQRFYINAGPIVFQVVASANPHVAAKALYFTTTDLDAVHQRASALNALSDEDVLVCAAAAIWREALGRAFVLCERPLGQSALLRRCRTGGNARPDARKQPALERTPNSLHRAEASLLTECVQADSLDEPSDGAGAESSAVDCASLRGAGWPASSPEAMRASSLLCCWKLKTKLHARIEEARDRLQRNGDRLRLA